MTSWTTEPPSEPGWYPVETHEGEYEVIMLTTRTEKNILCYFVVGQPFGVVLLETSFKRWGPRIEFEGIQVGGSR